MSFSKIRCVYALILVLTSGHVIICSSHLGVCTIWPRWPLWHWPESLKRLLHMAVKQEWHRLCVRHWDCERWKIKSRPTVWKVKMRLVVGSCRHFAKANFSSLAITKLDAIEVRGLVSVSTRWVLLSVLLCFASQEMFILLERKRGSQASLSRTKILFCGNGWRAPSLSLASHSLHISLHFFSSTTVFFFSYAFKEQSVVWSKQQGLPREERKEKLEVN